MALHRFLPLFLALYTTHAFASAPSGESWFTISSKHFRVHHTAPLEPYARALTQSFERALPELEKRLNWKAPDAIDVVVMDPSDSANGFAANFPNTHIELYSSPFGSSTALSYYVDWVNELATHELTHIVANDTTLGNYRPFRFLFGSWVKPNGLQPSWLSEGLAVFEETSLTEGGRGRSPLLEAVLREAVLEKKLNDSSYISLDRFNDDVPWWPGGNTPYLLGYTIQALPTKGMPNLPGKISYQNAESMVYSPSNALRAVGGPKTWGEVWRNASTNLEPRYSNNPLAPLPCPLTKSGNHTGGQAASSDGWIYFSEEDWNRGYHLARMRADAPCRAESIERLERKRYSGPTQVAVSPSGSQVAFSQFDPKYESVFSDIFLWRSNGSVDRATHSLRARDPAFLDETTLLFVKANADTSESLVQQNLSTGEQTAIFASKPFEKISAITSRNGRIVFSLHNNHGHEKITELKNNLPVTLVKTMHPTREFERNPFIANDGSIYFAASYGFGAQEIYRLAPNAEKPQLALSARSGLLDRPIVSADGKSIFVEEYGLNGMNIARAELPSKALALPTPKEDFHEFLTGEKPQTLPVQDQILPASAPYSTLHSSGTSLWPQYWFPEGALATDGILIGASTGGNDALEYHQYSGKLLYDSRAKFPTYSAIYRNRYSKTNIQLEATQTNNYFSSTKTSNRDATYLIEAISPLGEFFLAYGGAYRERKLFGSRTHNFLFFENTAINRSGKTPAAIAPNWGLDLSNFVAFYPDSQYENSFFDIRPKFKFYFPGFHPSHSISMAVSGGFTSNRLVTNNYYVGGGPSALDEKDFVVRGYPSDTLFGQKIATVNLAYTLPLFHTYRGLGTFPAFLSDIGLRLMADAGSANYTSVYFGNSFAYYLPSQIGNHRIYGIGGDLLAHGSMLYHVPYTLTVGLHYGTEKIYGGGVVGFLGFNIGLFGAQ